MKIRAEEYRYVRTIDAEAYLRAGWLPLPTLEGTHHEIWSVHMAWLCKCEPVMPRLEVRTAVPIDG